MEAYCKGGQGPPRAVVPPKKKKKKILCADDQILIVTSDELQTMAYYLNLIARKYKMTISSTKTKSMAMWGNHIQRVKNCDKW